MNREYNASVNVPVPLERLESGPGTASKQNAKSRRGLTDHAVTYKLRAVIVLCLVPLSHE